MFAYRNTTCLLWCQEQENVNEKLCILCRWLYFVILITLVACLSINAWSEERRFLNTFKRIFTGIFDTIVPYVETIPNRALKGTPEDMFVDYDQVNLPRRYKQYTDLLMDQSIPQHNKNDSTRHHGRTLTYTFADKLVRKQNIAKIQRLIKMCWSLLQNHQTDLFTFRQKRPNDSPLQMIAVTWW